MPTYLTLFKWTEQGIKNVKDTTKRAAKFREMFERSGGSLKDIYWTMGRYDGVIIFDALDEATAMASMVSGGSLGNVRTETLRAFTDAEMQGILAKMSV